MKILSSYIFNKAIGGAKAQTDIEQIAKNNFEATINNVVFNNDKKLNKFNIIKLKIKRYITVFKNIFSNDYCIIQVPFTNENVMKLIKNKVCFIHDIHGLQFNDYKNLKKELEFYKTCDLVIAHNKSMKKYLINNGIDKNKILELEIFDYLCELIPKKRKLDFNNILIAYTGSLNKSNFLNQLKEDTMNYTMKVYGSGEFHNKNNKIVLCGTFKPVDLPNIIDGDLGLIWDGNFDNSDENTGFKNYTKYNNPHKFSCYIAAELPVIAWEKSAIAETIKKYDIGYLINSLDDINNINLEDYYKKKENIKSLGQKVRNGYFTSKVLSEIEFFYNKGVK